MIQVNIHEAKTNLSKLLDRVAKGEVVIIARAGKPIARITKEQPRQKRVLGSMKGKIWIADDFDAPLPDELLNQFYGGEPGA